MSFPQAHAGQMRPSEGLGAVAFSADPEFVALASSLEAQRVRRAPPVGSGTVSRRTPFCASSAEEVRAVEHRMHMPAMPAQAGKILRQGIIERTAPALHDSRIAGFHVPGLNEFQRFRAAAYIQIREPELRRSAPRDLPVLSASLPWRRVGIVAAARPGTTPVPLRPSVQTPSFH